MAEKPQQERPEPPPRIQTNPTQTEQKDHNGGIKK
jgi:hypothetical protein